MNESDRQKIVKQFFESTLSSTEVDSYFERARDPSYWQGLNPELTIGGNQAASMPEAAPLDDRQTATQLEKCRREGYFQTAPVLDPGLVRRLCLAIDRVRAERWPPVFAYVYDEFWEIVRTPSMVRLVSAILGTGYRQNSLVWTFYVAPAKGAQGWRPHNDSGDESRLTVWVPLTDATLDNGCMYVIPRDRLTDDLRLDYLELQNLTNAQLSRLLQSTRALPTPAGAFLGWSHDVIHWGSVSSGHVEPRISLAVEFLAPGVEPRHDELPLFDPLTPLPPFADRLRAIAKGLLIYTRFEPAQRRYQDLGELLLGGDALAFRVAR